MQRIKLEMEVESINVGEVKMEKIVLREKLEETIADSNVQNGQEKLETLMTADCEYDYVDLHGSSQPQPEQKQLEMEADTKAVVRPNLVLVYFYSVFFWFHGLFLVIISSMALGYLNETTHLNVLAYSLEWTGLVIAGIVIGVIRVLLSLSCLLMHKAVDDKGRINICSFGAFVYLVTCIGLTLIAVLLVWSNILSFLYDGNVDNTGIRQVLSAFIYAVAIEPFFFIFGLCMKCF